MLRSQRKRKLHWWSTRMNVSPEGVRSRIGWKFSRCHPDHKTRSGFPPWLAFLWRTGWGFRKPAHIYHLLPGCRWTPGGLLWRWWREGSPGCRRVQRILPRLAESGSESVRIRCLSFLWLGLDARQTQSRRWARHFWRRLYRGIYWQEGR